MAAAVGKTFNKQKLINSLDRGVFAVDVVRGPQSSFSGLTVCN